MGTDTAVYPGVMTDYKFHAECENGSVTVTDQREESPDAQIPSTNVQNYRFDDGLVVAKPSCHSPSSWGPRQTIRWSDRRSPTGQLILGSGGNEHATDCRNGRATPPWTAVTAMTRFATPHSCAAGIVDTMIGGIGNDTYVVTRANDVIVEQLNAGVDVVSTNLAPTCCPAMWTIHGRGHDRLRGHRQRAGQHVQRLQEGRAPSTAATAPIPPSSTG